MPNSSHGSHDFDEAAEGFGRQGGKASPKRSRAASGGSPSGQSRHVRGKRKLKTPNGIHQRRNKRIAW